MATLTISDLPRSSALDHKAMSAITGADGAAWVFGAFVPFSPARAQVLPVVNNFFQQINFSETNYIANNLTLQNETLNVQNTAASSVVNVTTGQSALSINLPASPNP